MAKKERAVVIELQVRTKRTVRDLRKSIRASLWIGDGTEPAVFHKKPAEGGGDEQLVQVQVNEI